VFSVSPGSPNVAVKVVSKLGTNKPSKLVGKVPELLSGKDWYAEAHTYFSGGGTPLKETRVIRIPFTVYQA
jgi:hypothetical protein